MKSKLAKKAAKRVTAKQKPGRKPELANIRLATRVTQAENDRLDELALLHRRSVSAYIRELVVKHLEENPPPE